MNSLYIEDLKNTIRAVNEAGSFNGKAFFVTGANGLIGSFIIDVLMYLNEKQNCEITVIANGRNEKTIKTRFSNYLNDSRFKYYIGDINEEIGYKGRVDYIVNCASNTHPLQYASDPIGTIITNIQGTANVLDFAADSGAQKVIFLSSVEIYGENIYDKERFKENEMGYIDCNSLRAGYNEAKRCGEALCQAYIEQKGLDVSILRLPRIYGPTVKKDDSKVMSQFINRAINGEDIVLKSSGEQYFSYLYVADAVMGILLCLLNGKRGAVYNLGYIESDVRLKELAEIIAGLAGVKVVFDLPNETEAKGYSKATVARLDYAKAQKELGFMPKYSITNGVKKTIEILSDY